MKEQKEWKWQENIGNKRLYMVDNGAKKKNKEKKVKRHFFTAEHLKKHEWNAIFLPFD